MPTATSRSTSAGRACFLVAVLLGFVNVASAQLPSEIMADAYLLQVEQANRDVDVDRGRTVIQKIRSLQERHELNLEVEFYFRYARAAGALEMSDVALEFVLKYLAAAGREGQHYDDALALMNRSKAGSSRGDLLAKLSPDITADAELASAEEAILDGDVDHARTAIEDIRYRFHCMAAFNDFCALKQAPNEEARTQLRARIAQNCAVLNRYRRLGKYSYGI